MSGETNKTSGLSENEGLNDGVKNSDGITEYKTVIGYSTEDGETSNKRFYNTVRVDYVDHTLGSNLGRNAAPSDLLMGFGGYYLASRTTVFDDPWGPCFRTPCWSDIVKCLM